MTRKQVFEWVLEILEDREIALSPYNDYNTFVERHMILHTTEAIQNYLNYMSDSGVFCECEIDIPYVKE